MTDAELSAIMDRSWWMATGRPVFNAIACETGGLTRVEHWRGVAEQARALTAPKVAA